MIGSAVCRTDPVMGDGPPLQIERLPAQGEGMVGGLSLVLTLRSLVYQELGPL